jgi:uncharacterized membrane protein YheB (UPF0754 family)
MQGVELMKFLIPVLVGAVIGYITNWLAIKMLFRPHTKKKIFGITLPFTPGLIPKEKNRIAQSVGEMVATHLLSSETVLRALSSDKIDNQIRSWIENKVNNLLSSGRTIKDMTIELIGNKRENFQSTIEKRLLELIVSQLRYSYIKERILEIIKREVLDKLNEKTYSYLKDKARLFIFSISTSQEIEDSIKDLLKTKITDIKQDNRSISELIPKSLIDNFKIYIYHNSDKVINLLREVLKNSSFQRGIKSSISDVLKNSSNKFVAVFMSSDFVSENISDKIYEVIEGYIEKDDNKKSIVMTITNIIDKLLQEQVSKIITVIPNEDMESNINYLSDMIINFISDKENQSKILDIAEQRIRVEESSIKEKLLEVLSNKIEDILNSPKVEKYLLIIIHDSIESIINKPLSYVFKDLDDTSVSGIVNISKDIIDNIINSKSSYIVEGLNIQKLVEDQINSFDVAFAEKLIVEISNKELRAITWLGALLGGIMGLLSPLLQALQ